MSDTYEINDDNEVIPYTSGRRCNDTRSWRNATDLELQQRDEIARLESELERERDEARERLDAERALADRLAKELEELLYYDLDVNLGRLKLSKKALDAWKGARREKALTF